MAGKTPKNMTLNDEWVTWKAFQLRLEGLSLDKIGRWFRREHKLDMATSTYQRRLKKVQKQHGTTLYKEPEQYIEYVEQFTERDRRVKKNGKLLAKRDNEIQRLRKRVAELELAFKDKNSEKLLRLLGADIDSESDIVDKAHQIRTNNLDMLDTVKRLGMIRIIKGGSVDLGVLAKSMASFLGQIIPLEDKAIESLLEMDSRYSQLRSDNKVDEDKPITFTLLTKAAPETSDFEEELKGVLNGKN